jgi:hypothetical protein
MAKVDLDALGLLATQRQTTVHFGPVDVGSALKMANLSHGTNKMSDANLLLDLERATTSPDYFGVLAVAIEEYGHRSPRFTGSVASASPGAEGVTVNGLGALGHLDRPIGKFATCGLPTSELIYVLARSGGLRDEQLQIDGLDTLPRETFEIVAPIDGVELDEPTDFGGIRFLPHKIAIRALTALDLNDEMRADYDAPAYALALVTATRTLAAEEKGLVEIDVALAWLTTRLRYGLATLPNGNPLPFKRSESLTQVTRRDLVTVRGLMTMRQWLRQPGTTDERRLVALVPNGARLPSKMPHFTLQERLALLALARATREPDPLARVHALFESIEFYASGTTITDLFTKNERRLLRAKLASSFSPEQQERIIGIISNLNNAPLRLRLMQALDEDNVPINNGEVDLLWRLRTLRNDVVHGRRSELPAVEEVDYATSIVARMLVHRAATKDR